MTRLHSPELHELFRAPHGEADRNIAQTKSRSARAAVFEMRGPHEHK